MSVHDGSFRVGLTDGPTFSEQPFKLVFEPFEKVDKPAQQPTVGFFTDSSVCIGCKACEVACKQWNQLPADGMEFTGMSYDNTVALGARTWRHVEFIEQTTPAGEMRWLFNSDVCKHCHDAPCENACPTGALVRTEFDTVYVQQDICNGCGYCVAGCPFGVIEVDHEDGNAHKCTLCYDRLKDGFEPACAKACPTDSIIFGPLDELRERARKRVAVLHDRGVVEAQLYGDEPGNELGGLHALFLLLDDPEKYGLPRYVRSPKRQMREGYLFGLGAALAVTGLMALAFAGGRR